MSDSLYKKLLKIGIILITYVFILIHLPEINVVLNKFMSLLTPFVIGFVIAYILNPLVKSLKVMYQKTFKKGDNSGNIFAMFVSYLLLIFLIIYLFVSILPQLWLSINVIISEIPGSIESGYEWLETDGVKLLSKYTGSHINIDDIKNMFNVNDLIKNITSSLGTILTTSMSVLRTIINIVLGILISIYMLMKKDEYQAQIKKGIYALFSDDKAKKFLDFCSSVHLTFSRFISARIVDSIIIGILCYIGCVLLGFDNAVLIGFIVGITNIIPYFGPFIGAIPCALVVLLQGVSQMIIFCVFILILQQFDGNILGPKLLGDSLGLTSLWIIFAVTITTGVFGMVGMVIGVPLFAVVYMVIKNLINIKLRNKGKSTDTTDYF